MRRGLRRLWVGSSGLWVVIVLLLAAFVLAGPMAHRDFLDNCPDLKIPAASTRPVEGGVTRT
ncbi:hypothetical protein JOE48_005689 [Methylobacterium sp. PvR107]|nr:hypothetical protein [Methylobacterium sp. PvR107]